MGRTQPKPDAHEGDMLIRQMWTLSLVFDPQLVDGAPAARFFKWIKQAIEKPYNLLHRINLITSSL